LDIWLIVAAVTLGVLTIFSLLILFCLSRWDVSDIAAADADAAIADDDDDDDGSGQRLVDSGAAPESGRRIRGLAFQLTAVGCLFFVIGLFYFCWIIVGSFWVYNITENECDETLYRVVYFYIIVFYCLLILQCVLQCCRAMLMINYAHEPLALPAPPAQHAAPVNQYQQQNVHGDDELTNLGSSSSSSRSSNRLASSHSSMV